MLIYLYIAYIKMMFCRVDSGIVPTFVSSPGCIHKHLEISHPGSGNLIPYPTLEDR